MSEEADEIPIYKKYESDNAWLRAENERLRVELAAAREQIPSADFMAHMNRILARAENAQAERDAFRKAIEQAAHDLEHYRIWAGMGWDWQAATHPIHAKNAWVRLNNALTRAPSTYDQIQNPP